MTPYNEQEESITMKKKLVSVFLVLTMGLAVTAFAADLPFEDVPSGAWYYQDVASAYESGMIDGRDDTHFAPEANLTYAEAVKLAACMNQQYNYGFVDLGGSDPWYQDYVDYCYSEDIIFKDYNWNQPASRAGYVEIFAHALPEDALYARNDIADGTIPDVEMYHPQAEEIYLLYRAGVLTGNDDFGTFAPNSNIRRCEVAAILTRMMDDSARQDVTTGAPAPDEDRSEEIAALAGTWESDDSRPVFASLVIDGQGNWTYREEIAVGAVEETIEYSGTIVPAAGEPGAFYAVDSVNDVTVYFKFTPADENDVGSDLILWGANPGDDSVVFLREE